MQSILAETKLFPDYANADVARLEYELGIRGGAAYITEKSYRTAYDMIVQLEKLHRDFYPRLKRLREQNRSFSRVSMDDIRAAFPNAPASVARRLAQPFSP